MRTCISCGDPIPEKKRKHAKYCDKAACRGREYRKRQTETTTAQTERRTHPASTVLACPCGRRYLLQVCELDAQQPSPTPELSPPTSAPESLTQTVLPTDQGSGEPEPQADAPARAAESFTQTVLPTDQHSAEPTSTVQAAAISPESLTQTDRAEPQPGFATLELYFTDERERRIPFARAVHRQDDGRWTLHPGAKVAFSMDEQGRPCLGGKPGAWRKFYGKRSPSELGYDSDLAVMYWDQKLRRGRAASATVLRDLMGDGWKEKLREFCDGQRGA